MTDAEKGDKPGAYGWNSKTKEAGAFDGTYSWRKTGFEQTDEHPVVNVSWNDAVAIRLAQPKEARPIDCLPKGPIGVFLLPWDDDAVLHR